MPLQVTAIMIGVEDLARSKKFYAQGLGCAADRHRFVACQEALEALQHVGREGEKDLGFRRRGITGHPDHPSSSVRPVCAARYGPSLRNTLHFGNTLDPR